MTNQKTVGLVVAPGVTERLAENLIQEMPKMLSTHYDHQQEWIFDLVTDPLTGFAESVDEIFEKVADYHDKRQWDYVIAITDLPMFVVRHFVVIHHEKFLVLFVLAQLLYNDDIVYKNK